MKNIITFCACILAIAFFSSAQTNITGDIGGRLFEKEGSPYIVEGDVVVQAVERIGAQVWREESHEKKE